MIMTTLRSIIGEMELDEALSSRDKIKARLREMIADEAVDWGLTVKSVEIQDIKPSASMQKAMEQQASAERERKAVVTRAIRRVTAAIGAPTPPMLFLLWREIHRVTGTHGVDRQRESGCIAGRPAGGRARPDRRRDPALNASPAGTSSSAPGHVG